MPVTTTATVSYVLTGFQVDMANLVASAQFTKSVDGVQVQIFEVQIGSADLQTLLGAMPESGKPRGADITDAIYNYAIAHNVMAGTVS